MKILINFFANVNETSINQMINFVTQNIFNAQSQKIEMKDLELIIQIASNGGSSDHGLLAYNYLKQLDVKKTTINMSNVDSAAVLIFCAGDERYSTDISRFTLHEAITTVQGAFNSEKIHEIANLNKRITDDYIKVIQKVTGQKIKQLSNKIKDGYVLDTQEAIKIKLATKILNEPYIKTTNGVNAIMITNQVAQPQQQAQQKIIEN
jgi:ATP-dependent Clp protease protease subunit